MLLYIYIYTYMYVCVCVYIYIYIHIDREIDIGILLACGLAVFCMYHPILITNNTEQQVNT